MNNQSKYGAKKIYPTGEMVVVVRYIYDMDLNLISSNYQDTVKLDAGDYIIKFNHLDNLMTFTLNSNVW